MTRQDSTKRSEHNGSFKNSGTPGLTRSGEWKWNIMPLQPLAISISRILAVRHLLSIGGDRRIRENLDTSPHISDLPQRSITGERSWDMVFSGESSHLISDTGSLESNAA